MPAVPVVPPLKWLLSVPPVRPMPPVPPLAVFPKISTLVRVTVAPELGRIVAQSKAEAASAAQAYETRLLSALCEQATVPRQVNVLQHMQGYFKEKLSDDERKELAGIIRDYHEELVPLIVPITIFKHFIRKYDIRYLARQTYLNPHPLELKLRNHA